VTCPSCHARLRTQQAASPAPPAAAPPAAPPSAPTASAGADLAGVQADLQALRVTQDEILRTQREILALLRSRPAADAAADAEPGGDDDADVVAEPAPSPSPLRQRRRQKVVLLVDDDAAARREVQAAFARAQVPVNVAEDGHRAMAAIAAQKPDVIVLELSMGDPLPGRDVVNMIKATMEWVDIPIVLYTQVPIQNEREARQIHGADRYVQKGPGSADALVAMVIRVFQSA
jgi:CheY-like chemotaxis protein